MTMDVPAVRDLLDCNGKSVIVTGAGGGIGRAIALRFAEAGASVTVHYRKNESSAKQIVQQIEAQGRKAIAVRGDLAQQTDAQALIAETVRIFGGIDVLVNNAGAYPLAPLLDMSVEEWEEVITANLRSVHLCTQAAAREMTRQQRGGAIINIASIEAENPAPLHSHYTAAKAGVVMYTRTVAHELGRDGVRVNAVSPGLINRKGLKQEWPDGVFGYLEAAPLGRLGEPEDVADACLFLGSRAARWITGANLVVDGGVLTHRVF
jgi:NAD(P)-dependent dehydrogenase (short-subunit alcohol dehydrogenase family)